MTLFTLDDVEPVAPPRRRMTPGRIAGVAITSVIIVALVGAGLWALLNARRVADQFTVWNFTPTATLVGYMDRSAMTDEGRFLFLASTPAVTESDEFDAVCASHQEGVGILGCYRSSDKTIHLFDVVDERLDGLEDVVAAHEMLHAAWDRMSSGDIAYLEPLLEAEAARLSDDPEFVKRMAFYAESEPGQRANELHSIIGTEVASLSPELERHYAEYFTNRGALVSLHLTSNAVFVDLQERSAAIVAMLATLRAGIEADYADYNAGYDALNADIQSFNRRADNGAFDSYAAFERDRRSLLTRQASLDQLYASIQSRTADYDAGIAELDSLNAQVTDLNASINIEPRTGADM